MNIRINGHQMHKKSDTWKAAIGSKDRTIITRSEPEQKTTRDKHQKRPERTS